MDHAVEAFALAGPALGAQLLGLLVNLTGRWLAGNADTASATDQLALQGAQTTCFYFSWMIGSFGTLAGAGATHTGLTIGLGTIALNLPLSWIAFRSDGDWPGLGLAGIAWGGGPSCFAAGSSSGDSFPAAGSRRGCDPTPGSE